MLCVFLMQPAIMEQ